MSEINKYELIPSDKTYGGEPLMQIRALRYIENPYIDRDDPRRIICPGDLGGYVRCEDNLAQYGSCWIYPDSMVCDFARVSEDAAIISEWRDGSYSGPTLVAGSTVVAKSSQIYGGSEITAKAKIIGRSILENTVVTNAAYVGDNLIIVNSTIRDQAVLDNKGFGNRMLVEGADCRSRSEFWEIRDIGNFLKLYFFPNKKRDGVNVSTLFAGADTHINSYSIEDFKKEIQSSDIQYKSEVIMGLDLGNMNIRRKIQSNDRFFDGTDRHYLMKG